jgi:hypothetical protein
MGKDAVRSAKLKCGEAEEGKNHNGLVKDSDYIGKVENSYGACKMTKKELVNSDVADGGVTLWGRWGGAPQRNSTEGAAGNEECGQREPAFHSNFVRRASPDYERQLAGADKTPKFHEFDMRADNCSEVCQNDDTMPLIKCHSAHPR